MDAILDMARTDVLPALTARVLASAALAERREPEAIDAIIRSADMHRGDAVLPHFLGLLHRTQGDLTPAIAAFDRALVLTPNTPVLVHARARGTMEAGLDARDWYARARALAPNDGDLILGEAAAHAAAGDRAMADRTIVEMLRVHPGWLPGHAALTRLRYAAGQAWSEELDRAITNAPLDWRLHDMRIAAWLRIGDAEQSAAAAATAPDVRELDGLRAAIASEFDGRDADRRICVLDPMGDPTHRLYVLRHAIRRGHAMRVVEIAGAAPTSADLPYLSLAYRQLDDPRAAALDDPAAVEIVDIDLDEDEIDALADHLRTLHRDRHQPMDQSVRTGTQTDGMLLWRIEPVIAHLRRRLHDAVFDYAARARRRAAPLPVPRHPRFVGSWSVRLAQAGYHEAHVHPEGWLSSAVYVSLPDPRGREGWLTLGEPQSSLTTGLLPLREIEPRRARLVLFPSYMWHATRPFAAGERLTVAFDIA